VKELKVNFLGVHRPRASEWNPVKELKDVKPQPVMLVAVEWNPVKELKVQHSPQQTHRFSGGIR